MSEKSPGKCPVMHGAHTAVGSTANEHWWPKQINLRILHQHNPSGDPMGPVPRPARPAKGLRALILPLLAVVGCATTTTARVSLPPLETVAHVDVSAYLGEWYEIASFPQSFQRGCTATMATYTLRADGDVDVLNRCRKGSLDGEEKSALGRARVVDRASNAKLAVSFFRPFWGDYWIIDLADDYSYAVVGHPGRDYLWILARKPTMPEATYEGILERLRGKGYETSRLVLTQQPDAYHPSRVWDSEWQVPVHVVPE